MATWRLFLSQLVLRACSSASALAAEGPVRLASREAPGKKAPVCVTVERPEGASRGATGWIEAFPFGQSFTYDFI
jgi:hypothetical protein